ncbi:MAG TPA: carboxypeptidase regulatory-like domain-containing protein [Opitutaceae bacterium]|nr:carboxypeptidase regulatory-like domain-containing protein [Opitutaceae bacterium]
MTALGLHRIAALFAVLAMAPAALAQAAAEGRVELARPLHTPVMNKRYGIVAYAGVLSPFPPVAVVYLEGSFPRPAAPATAQMVQKDLMFLPWLLAVQVGTRVEFPNLDDTYHNIFSYSPAKRFDLGRYRSDERPIPSQLFDVPGLVTLRCDIHEHMRALILVLDTPHFAVSDAQGRYRLDGLPAGRYVLKAWLDSKTTLERPVLLQSGATLHADFP